MKIGIDEWMVAWTPGTPDAIMVGAWPDKTGWSKEYEYSAGCCMSEWHDLSNAQKDKMLLLAFHSCVVRDGIDPRYVHSEFLKIDRYCRIISPDIKGAIFSHDNQFKGDA